MKKVIINFYLTKNVILIIIYIDLENHFQKFGDIFSIKIVYDK